MITSLAPRLDGILQLLRRQGEWGPPWEVDICTSIDIKFCPSQEPRWILCTRRVCQQNEKWDHFTPITAPVAWSLLAQVLFQQIRRMLLGGRLVTSTEIILEIAREAQELAAEEMGWAVIRHSRRFSVGGMNERR